jgi:hypothetical protein
MLFAALAVALTVPAAAQAAVRSDTACRPARVIVYAGNDWQLVASRLAANPSPCAQYYVTVPPLAADKTAARPNQAGQIRALGPNFHAVDEISYTAWSAWVAGGGGTFADAGAEARRRMAAAGFDTAAGDTWALNELSSAVRVGTGSARTNAEGLLQGLAADGVKGIAFVTGISQSTPDLSLYKANLEGWLQDPVFWTVAAGALTDFAQENYGDVRAYAVPGSTPEQRRDALVDYLGHELALANAAPDSAAGARTFLQQAHVPVGTAAWGWTSGLGYTAVPLQTMEDFVSGQVYAARTIGAVTGAPVDRIGFAWGASGVAPGDRVTLLDRLAAAIHDSDAAPANACAPAWCTTSLDGAAFTSAWSSFAAWAPPSLAVTAPQTFAAGAVVPVAVQVQADGVAVSGLAGRQVTFTTSSPAGGFAASPQGPFTQALAATVAAGSSTATVYYSDTRAGTPELSAALAGQAPAVQTPTVTATELAQLSIAAPVTKVVAGGHARLAATGVDRYGNTVQVTPAWAATRGSVSRGGVFTAPPTGGPITVRATVGGVAAVARLTVFRPKPRIVATHVRRIAGRIAVGVAVRPAGRVALTVRVRRGSSVVAVLHVRTTRAGTFTWRSRHRLPAGRYVVRAAIRASSTA